MCQYSVNAVFFELLVINNWFCQQTSCNSTGSCASGEELATTQSKRYRGYGVSRLTLKGLFSRRLPKLNVDLPVCVLWCALRWELLVYTFLQPGNWHLCILLLESGEWSCLEWCLLLFALLVVVALVVLPPIGVPVRLDPAGGDGEAPCTWLLPLLLL